MESFDGNAMTRLRLGINVDHVATLRNARGVAHPDPLRAAQAAIRGGAQNITAHLREDRRHIRDDDMARLKEGIAIPLNMEMAATPQMSDIALSILPHACCIVPERREEMTTERGLDAAGQHNTLVPFVRRLNDAGIRVSLFIDPDAAQVEAAKRIGAPAIELHTGTYAERFAEGGAKAAAEELERLRAAAAQAHAMGLEVHAGHGLDYDNVPSIAAIPQIVELNIGHFLVGEAVFTGLEASVRQMRRIMDIARAEAGWEGHDTQKAGAP